MEQVFIRRNRKFILQFRARVGFHVTGDKNEKQYWEFLLREGTYIGINVVLEEHI